MRYLIIRPEGKCQRTCGFLAQQGIECAALPLLKLEPNPDQLALLQQDLANLQSEDLLLVTSTAVAEFAGEQLHRFMRGSGRDAIFATFAVGASSAQRLNLDDGSVRYPELETSEGLLALIQEYRSTLEVANSSKPKALLLKGFGGRGLLTPQLAAMGYQVIERNLYRRVSNPDWVKHQDWHASDIGCVVATSGELLQAAFNEPSLDKEWLRRLPWIVVGDRMAEIAKALGIGDIFVSAKANDAALLAAMKQFPGVK